MNIPHIEALTAKPVIKVYTDRCDEFYRFVQPVTLENGEFVYLFKSYAGKGYGYEAFSEECIGRMVSEGDLIPDSIEVIETGLTVYSNCCTVTFSRRLGQAFLTYGHKSSDKVREEVKAVVQEEFNHTRHLHNMTNLYYNETYDIKWRKDHYSVDWVSKAENY